MCREFGHTAPRRGAFWLIQMLGTAPVGAARAEQVEPVLDLKPIGVLRGNGKTLFKGQWRALVGIDELARHVRLAIDVAGAGMRLDNQIERPFRRSNPSCGRKLAMSRGALS